MRTVSHTAGKHDDFVVTVNLIFLFVFKGEYGTANQRLAELVSEIAGAVGCLNQDLFGSLVQPFAYRKYFLPGTVFVRAGVGSHVYGCSGNRP